MTGLNIQRLCKNALQKKPEDRHSYNDADDSVSYRTLLPLCFIASLSCFLALALLPLGLAPGRVPLMGAVTAEASLSEPDAGQKGILRTDTSEVPSVESIIPEVGSSTSALISSDDSSQMYSEDLSGILQIPSLDLELTLASADIYTDPGRAQELVDLEDTAALFKLGGCTVIADHDGQGFARLSELEPGAACRISRADGSADDYTAVLCSEGTNDGSDISLADGSKISELPRKSLVMYTCRGNWKHVSVVVWERL